MEQVPNYNARLRAIIERITAEVCLAAVQQNGGAIQYMTDDQRTAEVCLAAVQQNGGAIWHLTDDQKQRAGL